MYIYIYIYVEREREREREIDDNNTSNDNNDSNSNNNISLSHSATIFSEVVLGRAVGAGRSSAGAGNEEDPFTVIGIIIIITGKPFTK